MGPFLKDKNTTKKTMTHLLISLTLIILFAFIKNGIIPYKKGYTDIIGMLYPLFFIGVGTFTTYIFEFLINLIITKNIKQSLKTYSTLQGIFLALMLPINTPIWILILGALVSSIISNILQKLFGNKIFNPTLIGCLFITTIFASIISNNGGYLNKYEQSTMTTTPIINATKVEGIGTYETLIKPYGSLSKMFIGTVPGALGETSTLLSIIALAYLVYSKAVKWRIPVTYITTVFAMTYVIGGSNNLGIWYPLFQISSGGLVFYAIFIAANSETSPVTPIGQVLYGMFLGILTVIFRFILPYEQGIIVSILIMNILVIVLDKIGAQSRFNFKIALMPFLISWILILGLSLVISMKYDNKDTHPQNEQIEQKELEPLN